MLKFSLSGIVLVIEAVQTTAAVTNATNTAVMALSTMIAIVAAVPEISRWANAFVTGEAVVESTAEAESAVDSA